MSRYHQGPSEAKRLMVGMAMITDSPDPLIPWHHREEFFAALADDCPKRAEYVDQVVARLRAKPVPQSMAVLTPDTSEMVG